MDLAIEFILEKFHNGIVAQKDNMSELSKEVDLNRENLYCILSKKGNLWRQPDEAVYQ